MDCRKQQHRMERPWDVPKEELAVYALEALEEEMEIQKGAEDEAILACQYYIQMHQLSKEAFVFVCQIVLLPFWALACSGGYVVLTSPVAGSIYMVRIRDRLIMLDLTQFAFGLRYCATMNPQPPVRATSLCLLHFNTCSDSENICGRRNGGARGSRPCPTRPLCLKLVKNKALVKKNRICRDENQPPTPTRDEAVAEDQENLRPPPTRDWPKGDFKEEDSITMYRRTWERRWADRFGSFDDQTSIGPMCYTSEPPTPEYLFREQTVQIFSIRVRTPTDGLKWPLHVHGYVATRDSMDHNRNYLFRRTGITAKPSPRRIHSCC
ncbi:uncharacterized protein LOC119350491 [Triticum dicoccoides]|uniref:uncharacterized protein LOC119350491 n=1 Tax=Triticum dicoccoides TaxID=85692 RepID=UPI00188E653E|nr:uncharacterized protein LOC119350491 [Triticum dicoccoides]